VKHTPLFLIQHGLLLNLGRRLILFIFIGGTSMNEQLRNALENFLTEHLAKREGERYRRLKEGHGHAEQLFLQQV
jgi:hypothetical protein